MGHLGRFLSSNAIVLLAPVKTNPDHSRHPRFRDKHQMRNVHTQPPARRWIRLARAAPDILGMSQQIALAEIEAGRLPCQVRHLGKRGIMHVASDEVAAAALALNGKAAQ